MLIGVLGVGMLLGTTAAVGALIAGQSFLTALFFYISVGLVSTGVTAGGVFVCRSRARSNPGKARAKMHSDSWQGADHPQARSTVIAQDATSSTS